MNKKELRKLLLEQERVSEARSKRIDKLMREIDKSVQETAVFQMKNKNIHLLSPGARCIFSEDLVGEICAVLIEPGGAIKYQVVWWNGRQREIEWLFEFEVASHQITDEISVGFAK